MDIVVYDNSPTSMVSDFEYMNSTWTIHYIHDKMNSGVSKAYNEGFGIAEKLNKKWILLLDQDTFFPQNAVVKYSNAIRKYSTISLFAPVVLSKNKIISPCRYFLNKGFSLRRIEPGIHNFKRKSLINSGMLISVDTYKKIGGYNENIRLDFADHFFIQEYKAVYSYFGVIDMKCLQNFSPDQQLTANPAVERFSFYCEGARAKAVNKLDYLNLMLIVIFRSVMLFLKYMDLRFFRTAKKKFWN